MDVLKLFWLLNKMKKKHQQAKDEVSEDYFLKLIEINYSNKDVGKRREMAFRIFKSSLGGIFTIQMLDKNLFLLRSNRARMVKMR